MKSNRHVNLPGVKVNLPSITEKDKADIEFGVKNEVDYIGSFFCQGSSRRFGPQKTFRSRRRKNKNYF